MSKLIIICINIIMIVISMSIIISYVKYLLLKRNSHKMYNYNINQKLYISSLNGLIGITYICVTSEEFEDFIKSIKPVELLTVDTNNYVNPLENHYINYKTIVINNIIIIPKSYLDYLIIMSYIFNNKDNRIIIHDISKNGDENQDEFYNNYTRVMLELINDEKIKSSISDIVVIEESGYNDNQFIWRDPESKVVYIHKYLSDPVVLITILAIYLLKDNNYFLNNYNICNEVDKIVKRIIDTSKASFYTFICEDIRKVINETMNIVIDYTPLNMEYIISEWMYNPWSYSVWKYHTVTDRILNTLSD